MDLTVGSNAVPRKPTSDQDSRVFFAEACRSTHRHDPPQGSLPSPDLPSLRWSGDDSEPTPVEKHIEKSPGQTAFPKKLSTGRFRRRTRAAQQKTALEGGESLGPLHAPSQSRMSPRIRLGGRRAGDDGAALSSKGRTATGSSLRGCHAAGAAYRGRSPSGWSSRDRDLNSFGSTRRETRRPTSHLWLPGC